MMSTAHDESILHSLRRIARAMDVFSRRLSASHQLTAPQLVCLHQLSGGGMTPSELARQASLSQATVTGIVDRLEARSLVARARDQVDRRKVSLHLTELGREFLAKSPLPLHKRFSARLDRLPSDEQANIDRVLQRIAQMMEDDIQPDEEPELL